MPGRWLEPDESVVVSVELNGTTVSLETSGRRTLADSLRGEGLTGTHLGCEHGVCGSCTVLLDGSPVRSCLMLAVQADGRSVETVEGLVTDHDLSPLQRMFDAGGALQCGFCTPGFLMLATGILRQDPAADREKIAERLTANVCRCTGGEPVLRAVLAAQQELLGNTRPADTPEPAQRVGVERVEPDGSAAR
ncbi:(2Fe-2S)-binding protein [Kribbella sp. NPDC050459]|uniref:(2Fe-2S)-binding protein n=1 Tax=Kribbella sp. NPDC050459 TaxID=3155785 RepID=UPI003400210D